MTTWVLEKFEVAGHSGGHITLKSSDQEQSFVAVKRAIAARKTARTSLMESQFRRATLWLTGALGRGVWISGRK